MSFSEMNKNFLIRSFSLVILFLMTVPFYGQNTTTIIEDGVIKAECCEEDPIYCTPFTYLFPGVTYEIYFMFTLNNSTPVNMDINSLSAQIFKPSGLQITPDNVTFYSIVNGNIANRVSPPFTLIPNKSKNYVAKIHFKFTPNSTGTIEPGTYIFRANASGIQNIGTSFLVSLDKLFTVWDEEEGDMPEEECNGGLQPSGTSTQKIPSFDTPLTSQWFPNPTQNSAILEIDLVKDSQVEVEIMDMQGRTLMRPNVDQQVKSGVLRKKIDVSRLPAGIYYTRISTDTETQVIKWVKLE